MSSDQPTTGGLKGSVAAIQRHCRELRDYVRSSLKADAVAGLTIAVMGLPQAMAYALIAGLPPIYGIYTAIVPTIVAAALGSSRHLCTGPTNAMCMVIFSLTTGLPERYGVSQLQVVLALTLLAGLFQLGLGLLKLGGVVKYVSNSVVVGFTAGAGLLIVANQLKGLMGVKLPEEAGRHFLVTFWATLGEIPHANPYALAVGLVTILLLAGFRRWAPKAPGALVTIVLVSLLAWFSGWSSVGPDGGKPLVGIVRDMQPITASMAPFEVPEILVRPNLNLLKELLGGALAVAILGLVESTSIARGIAASSGQRLDFNREFAGQGISKVVGSFFSCFSSSGSITRSALCLQSGGRTRVAPALSGVFTGVVLILFGPLANYVPLPCLAGILVMTAFTMINRERLLKTWRSGSNSRIVLTGTFFSTVLMPLEFAVFAGVMLSIGLLLRVTSKADLTQLVQHPDYGFEEVPFNKAAPSPVAIINLEGDLYFAAAEDLDYELLQALRPETRVVILRLKRLRAVGSSAMGMLEHFHQLLKERGIHLLVCGVEDELKGILTGSGVRNLIGEQNIFYADNRIFQSTELALARAMTLLDMERERAGRVEAMAQKRVLEAITASEIMQKRCLRFGHKHQVREAMWLISQFQKRLGTEHPQTVFLQDEEGHLAGQVSLRDILAHLAASLGREASSARDDAELARRLRPQLFKDVRSLARSDLEQVAPDAPLGEIFLRAARHGFHTMPVCDEHGRLAGVVDEAALFRGLMKLHHAGQAPAAGLAIGGSQAEKNPSGRENAGA